MVNEGRRKFLKFVAVAGLGLATYGLLRDKVNLPPSPSSPDYGKEFKQNILKNYEDLKNKYLFLSSVSTAVSFVDDNGNKDFYEVYSIGGNFYKNVVVNKKVNVMVNYKSGIPKDSIENKIQDLWQKNLGGILSLSTSSDDYLPSINVIDSQPIRQFDDFSSTIIYKDENDAMLSIIQNVLSLLDVPACFEENCVNNYKTLPFLHSDSSEAIIGKRCKTYLMGIINGEYVGKTSLNRNASIDVIAVKLKDKDIVNYKDVSKQHNLDIIKFLSGNAWNKFSDMKVNGLGKNLVSYSFLFNPYSMVNVTFADYLSTMKVI